MSSALQNVTNTAVSETKPFGAKGGASIDGLAKTEAKVGTSDGSTFDGGMKTKIHQEDDTDVHRGQGEENGGEAGKKKKRKKKKKKKAKSTRTDEDIARELGLIPLKAPEVDNVQNSLDRDDAPKVEKEGHVEEPQEHYVEPLKKPIVIYPPTPPPGTQQSTGVEEAAVPPSAPSIESDYVMVNKSSPPPLPPARPAPPASASTPMPTPTKPNADVMTPMAHIDLGNLRVDDGQMNELDTPNPKVIAQRLSGRAVENDNDIDKKPAARKLSSPKSGGGKYSAWDNYEAIDRFGSSPEKAAPGSWSCTVCTLLNDKPHAAVCECCGSARPQEPAKDEGMASFSGADRTLAQHRRSSWGCKACSFENEVVSSKKCEVCETVRDDDDGFAMCVEVKGDSPAKSAHKNKKKKGAFGFVKSLFGFGKK